MIFGSLLSVFLFAPLSYLLTRMSVRFGYRSGNRWIVVPVVFGALLVGLSLLALAMVAAASVLGFSVALAGDALASTADLTHPGVISALGALVMGLWGILGFLSGPAAAFVAAKVTTVISLIAALTKMEEEQAVQLLPLLGALAGGICMWPFTTFLTLGL